MQLLFLFYLYADEEQQPQEFGPGEPEDTGDPHRQQVQPPHHRQAVPAHRQTLAHARQHPLTLRQRQRGRRWRPDAEPAAEVRQVVESAAAVHRVPPTAEAPQAAAPAGPGLEPREDAGQRPVNQHEAALVRHWSPTSADNNAKLRFQRARRNDETPLDKNIFLFSSVENILFSFYVTYEYGCISPGRVGDFDYATSSEVMQRRRFTDGGTWGHHWPFTELNS